MLNNNEWEFYKCKSLNAKSCKNLFRLKQHNATLLWVKTKKHARQKSYNIQNYAIIISDQNNIIHLAKTKKQSMS